MQIVWNIATALLMAAGVLGLGWLAFGRLLGPVGRTGRSLAVIPVSGDGGEVEREVRGLLWLKNGNMARFQIVIADCGLNDEGRALVALLQQWEPSLVVCGAEKLGEYMAERM